MLAYAANRPRIAARLPSPNSMLFIASAHVVAIAVLMSAKMDLPGKIFDPPITIIDLPAPPVPPRPADPRQPTRPQPIDISNPQPLIPLPPRPGEEAQPDPSPGTGASTGPATDPFPGTDVKPIALDSGPVLITPAGELRPPYPRSKLLLEEEASLTLKLSIDTIGRVIAVEPVGRADRIFLDAARRHLIARWRYRPAMSDSHAVPATLITTLHFRLDG